ncbi:MAG: 16S rRNA (adenine(1518)-N(6)/adenine(1519)-N(6))-dimethyltransferase RsmA [Patescibacteria group bacterium]|nr:16S rRNA (adenine(1518)-N(6)/adenine(1519)-N(6))-dimethyltransferase RsmA [Patescibacteria group bacterium]
MDLLRETKNICSQHKIKPARSKGQNFLIRENVYDKIIETAELNKADIILEVGPGFGFLTEKLAQKVKKVIAVELDDKLTNILQNRLNKQSIKNVEVLNRNILDVTSYELRVASYKIVANLPYNITSIFLRKFLSAENKPDFMVLMLQKEVAERICAKPGKMSLLSVSAQYYARPKIIEYVPKHDFWPSPKVDSAIVKLRIHKETKFPAGNLVSGNEKVFFRLVKFGFSSKRKMLKNNLAAGCHISQIKAKNRLIKAGFKENIRAQELSVRDWIKLFGSFRQNML